MSSLAIQRPQKDQVKPEMFLPSEVKYTRSTPKFLRRLTHLVIPAIALEVLSRLPTAAAGFGAYTACVQACNALFATLGPAGVAACLLTCLPAAGPIFP